MLLAVVVSLGLLVGPAGSPPACDRPARAFAGGRAGASLCPAEASAAGLTAIDLRDAWVPFPFEGAAAAQGREAPAYRDTLIALADVRPGARVGEDGDLELYGVAPGPRVVLAELSDDDRHRCHDAVDDAALVEVEGTLHREEPGRAEARRDELARLSTRIDAIRRRHGEGERPGLASVVRRAERLAGISAAIEAAQRHLVCEGLLPAGRRSVGFDGATALALARYQRRHWIVGGGELDEETRAALASDSRELDFQRALRLLRQRVADAAGLIEDGSARNEWGRVLGRDLDRAAMRYEGGYPSLPEGAPDRISAATEAAALALGWRDPASARDALTAMIAGGERLVAVALPPVPKYHQAAMSLRAVIERRAGSEPGVRPVLTLYARDGDGEVALVRWPTTVGGWKDEKGSGGAIVRRFKPSDVGPRVWRDLVVAPVWFAPDTTPDDELVGVRDGRWSVKEDLIGPGYRSAYGLAMLVHHEVVARRDGEHYLDHGIRTHGSVSYRSILTGSSHGCHRLYNHQALRLASFLLRHREYTVHGSDPEVYVRRVRARGRTWAIRRESRGYRYELTPPVPIDVRVGVVTRVCES